MDAAEISVDELEIVAFYDKPFLKFEKNFRDVSSFAPKGISSLKAMPLWIKKKLWIKTLIQDEIDLKENIISRTSCFTCSFSVLCITFSKCCIFNYGWRWGMGYYKLWYRIRNKMEVLADIKFPNSLGLLYSFYILHRDLELIQVNTK